jgi:glycosyltransferase involved in cell wall biosynthesis
MADVSIIIPIYNAQDYMDKCLESVMEQTYSDIEILLINDGSTDGSLEKCKEWAEKDNRIICIDKENEGLGPTRNLGIRSASSDFITFCDPDDWYDVQFVEKMLKKQRDTDADIVTCGRYQYDGTRNKTVRTIIPTANSVFSGFWEYWDWVLVNSFCVKLLRRSLFIDNDVWLPPYYGEDTAVQYFILTVAKRVEVLKEPLYYYWFNRGDSINNSTKRHASYTTRVLKYGWELFKKAGIFEHYKRQLLNEAYFIIGNQYSKIKDDAQYTREWLNGCIETIKEYFGDMLSEGVELVSNGRYVPRIIVSLTSYTKRIPSIHNTFETLFSQTRKADRIILWLSEEELPRGRENLPQTLLDYCKKGLEIHWCNENLKPHKKYFHVMQLFPEDIIITVDDDVIYDETMIEVLYNSYKRFPKAVSAMRTHIMTFDDKKISPYNRWKLESSEIMNIPSMHLFATGAGGILYPPLCMHQELYNHENILKTALLADDIWLKVMQVMRSTPVVCATAFEPLAYVENTQDSTLWHYNAGGGNDEQLSNVLSIYDGYFGASDTLTSRIYADYIKKGKTLSTFKTRNTFTHTRIFSFLLIIAVAVNIVQFRSIETDIRAYREGSIALENHPITDIYQRTFSETPGYRFLYGLAFAVSEVSDRANLILPPDFKFFHYYIEDLVFFGNLGGIERLDYDHMTFIGEIDLSAYIVRTNEDRENDWQFRIMVNSDRAKATEFIMIRWNDGTVVLVDTSLLPADKLEELREMRR